ncbi:MAG TPA: NfeD family protein [Clostridiaceae bacterium]|nr:NfeD family protein [Clostridiaceae bacterium]
MVNLFIAHVVLGVPDVLFWGIILAIAVVAELATLNLVSLWFIFGALSSLIATLLGASVVLQFVLFIVLSGIGFFIFFFAIRPKLANRVVRATNADRIIGKEGVVIELIDSMAGTGQIKVQGQIWSARLEEEGRIEEGELVNILGITGVKAIVEPIKRDASESSAEIERQI